MLLVVVVWVSVSVLFADCEATNSSAGLLLFFPSITHKMGDRGLQLLLLSALAAETCSTSSQIPLRVNVSCST
jgi:hypothetical protein